jgi:hypothetical protein
MVSPSGVYSLTVDDEDFNGSAPGVSEKLKAVPDVHGSGITWVYQAYQGTVDNPCGRIDKRVVPIVGACQEIGVGVSKQRVEFFTTDTGANHACLPANTLNMFRTPDEPAGNGRVRRHGMEGNGLDFVVAIQSGIGNLPEGTTASIVMPLDKLPYFRFTVWIRDCLEVHG